MKLNGRPSSAKPTKWRQTQIPVEGHEETIFDVPDHVSRVDSGAKGASGWHGWQVRWPDHTRKVVSEFFRDTHYSNDPAKSLKAAIKYRNENYPGMRSAFDPHSYHIYRRAMGVRTIEVTKGRGAKKRVELQKTEPTSYLLYLAAHNPLEPTQQFRVYLGVEGSPDIEKRKPKALEKLLALRAEAIAQHDAKNGLLPKYHE